MRKLIVTTVLFSGLIVCASAQTWSNFKYYYNSSPVTEQKLGPKNTGSTQATYAWSTSCTYVRQIGSLVDPGEGEGEEIGDQPPWNTGFDPIYYQQEVEYWTGTSVLDPGYEAYVNFKFDAWYGEDGWYKYPGGWGERYRSWPIINSVTPGAWPVYP